MTTSKTKHRSPSPLGPEQKHAKHEHTPTDAFPPENPFFPFRNRWQSLEEDVLLNFIHVTVFTWVLASGNKEFKTKMLVDPDQFQANVGTQRSQFLESFHKMVAPNCTQDELEAFLNHGMSRCYETTHLTSDP